ncbi:MAG TPA: hypothetical protein VFP25_05810 [Nitrososphaeraceae archaeon]|nr:hypothetical protein [Nitrososphaeraceae archaeon]
MKRILHKCRYCNHYSTRKWNMKRHIERKHPNMPNYLNPRSNKSSNISTEFQNNSTNNSIYISLFDRYAPLIKSNPVWYEQISRFQEVLENIKQMKNDEIVYIIIFALDLALKRGIR